MNTRLIASISKQKNLKLYNLTVQIAFANLLKLVSKYNLMAILGVISVHLHFSFQKLRQSQVWFLNQLIFQYLKNN